MALPTSSASDVFQTYSLRDHVELDGRYLNRHLLKSIENALRNQVEGRCTRHGFIRPGSVIVNLVGPGIIAPESGGRTCFTVDFDADVCNPLKGSTVKCRIESSNAMAALAVNLGDPRVLEILIPPEPKAFKHSVPFAELKVGSEVTLKVVGKRFNLGQKSIVCAGQVIEATTPAKVATEVSPGAVEVQEGELKTSSPRDETPADLQKLHSAQTDIKQDEENGEVGDQEVGEEAEEEEEEAEEETEDVWSEGDGNVDDILEDEDEELDNDSDHEEDD